MIIVLTADEPRPHVTCHLVDFATRDQHVANEWMDIHHKTPRIKFDRPLARSKACRKDYISLLLNFGTCLLTARKALANCFRACFIFRCSADNYRDEVIPDKSESIYF